MLHAIIVGNEEGIRAAAERALAVHDARWGALGEDARMIEGAKEVVEGTAKYVEARSVGSFARWCEQGRASDRLCTKFLGEDAASWLLVEIRRRFAGDAIAPQDMPRNRMYTVAATIGLLLDHFEPGWKANVEKEGTLGTLFGRLGRAVPSDRDPELLLAKVQKAHGWEHILASSRAEVQKYRRGYEKARAAFERTAGRRVVIDLPRAGFSRSRSARGTGWIVDGGAQVLGHYSTYTRRRRHDPSVYLSIDDRSVLEESLVDDRRRLTLFVSGQLTATVDETTGAIADTVRKTDFNRLELRGEGLQLLTEAPGRLIMEDDIRIRILD